MSDGTAGLDISDAGGAQARARLREAAESTGAEAALTALRWALEWSRAALAAEQPPSALVAMALDDALQVARGFAGQVAEGLPALPAAAPVRDDIAAGTDRLGRLARQVAEARRAAEQAQRLVADQEAQAEELRALNEVVDQVRRREGLFAALDELRAFEQALRDRSEALASHTDSLDTDITRVAETFHPLAEQALAALAPDARAAAVRAVAAEGRLREQQAELEDLRTRVEQAGHAVEALRTEHDQTVAALRLYHEADEKLLVALTKPSAGVDGGATGRTAVIATQAALNDIAARLTTVDAALGEYLTAARAEYREQHVAVARGGRRMD
jgi:DNA repair exonuclease SbcCD ATPase subunit